MQNSLLSKWQMQIGKESCLFDKKNHLQRNHVYEPIKTSEGRNVYGTYSFQIWNKRNFNVININNQWDYNWTIIELLRHWIELWSKRTSFRWIVSVCSRKSNHRLGHKKDRIPSSRTATYPRFTTYDMASKGHGKKKEERALAIKKQRKRQKRQADWKRLKCALEKKD